MKRRRLISLVRIQKTPGFVFTSKAIEDAQYGVTDNYRTMLDRMIVALFPPSDPCDEWAP